MVTPLEIVCPAGTPTALRAAVDAGADTVYLGFADETNARNFPGLNFSRAEVRDGVAYAHDRGATVYVTVNTFPRAGALDTWQRAADDAVEAGADAVIVADIGVCDYVARNHPDVRLHLSVQASATSATAIDFYQRAFGVKRVVLPRVLTLAEIADLNSRISVETEVFVFGGLCVMAEGRCALSSYVTDTSPNRDGACSPAADVAYVERDGMMISKLGPVTVNAVPAGEPAGYPTLCKGRFQAGGKTSYLFEDPTSLNAIGLLPELASAGVRALKIEGRQRGRAYVSQIVSAFRRAADAVAAGSPIPALELASLTEGRRGTEGAYSKAWR